MKSIGTGDVLTRVTHYHLMRNGKSLLIDVHELIEGTLAGRFLAVPNLVMILAPTGYQGVGETADEALQDCLVKIEGLTVDQIFPSQPAT